MRIKGIITILKRNKIIFFSYRKWTSKFYKESIKEFNNNNFQKTQKQIKDELKLIEEYWGCDPMHYFRYRLFIKDLTKEELLDYIPPYYFYNNYLKYIYNNMDLKMYESKIFLGDLFKEKDIKTPRTIAIVKKKILYNSKGQIIDFNMLIDILSQSKEQKFFLKPDNGKGGKGIKIIIGKIDNYFVKDNVSKKKFIKKILMKNDCIIQEAIIQRKDISKINNSSVNTLRIITQNRDKKIMMPVAVMRMGRKESFVDNSAQGGISIDINTNTGYLNDIAYEEYGCKSFKQHPDSNFVFKGFCISGWSAIKNKVLKYANKIPELEEIAWDIAIGVDDIYVIEVNINYGIDHLQCTAGGMRRVLGLINKK